MPDSIDLTPLLKVLAALRHPEEGCPWDRDLTLQDLPRPLVEEAEELAEALASGDDEHVAEEAGDLLWNVLMLIAIAEDEGRFAAADVVERVRQKMISRHPHVFGETKAATVEEAREAYQRAKRGETR